MRRRAPIWRVPILVLTGLMIVSAPAAVAHVTRPSGPFEVSFGWGNEPPYSGEGNFVEVGLADRSGAPVGAPPGALRVEVTFSGARTTLPLVPDGEQPGSFRAALVPTRPGTYAFHITGTVRGQAIDTAATCSERTFECVNDISEVEFPVKDPSAGDLAQAVTRVQPRVNDAADTADSARAIAIAAIAVAVVSLLSALWLGLRRRPKNG